MDYTRKMLNEIRNRIDGLNQVELPQTENIVEQDNLLNRFNVLVLYFKMDIKN